MACNLDHSVEDTKKKLEDQKAFLPEELFEGISERLNNQPDQTELNELFHLLKKYDLSSESEKMQRNEQIRKLI